jgi:AraC-like DNA-binding protein
MDLSTSYWFLLCISFSCVIAQLFVKDKQYVHIFFAIFCGSVAMMAAQKLSTNASANIGFLFGLGACATCNGYWLVARSLFRHSKPVTAVHLLLAASVAMLVILKRSLSQLDEIIIGNFSVTLTLSAFVGEILMLLSSCMMVMTIWEGIRNWSQLNSREKKQRITFLSAILGSMLTATIFGGAAIKMGLGPDIKTMLIPFAATAVIVTTQVLIFWRFAGSRRQAVQHTKCEEETRDSLVFSQAELELASQLKSLLQEKKLFLQSNLKVSDLARELDVSEYRISRALRLHFDGTNFNQLVNQLRVEHAKGLLEDTNNSQWPVLVIGLESGFASVGPFTRAFKEIVGETPGRYRKKLSGQSLNN